jgi:hypothetical protein
MPVLSSNEADVLDAVRWRASDFPDGTPAYLIRDRVWRSGRGLTYDQTNRALTSLVKKGLLVKPVRGKYNPA